MIWRLVRLLSKLLLLFGSGSALADDKARQTKKTLKVALQAKEIENEVEALSTDTLKRRSRVWVRNPDR
jgi:hypothetical protein